VTIFVFIIAALALFGPKIGGVLDLSAIGGVLGLVLLSGYKRISVSQEYVVVVVLVVLVLAYSTLAVLFDQADDMQPFLRHVRALLSTALLSLFFYNIALSAATNSAVLVKVLLAVLLLNAGVVLVSVWNPGIQTLLADMYGFDKSVRPLRSFGLTSGYDTAGYLCVVGALISSISIYFRKSKTDLVALVIFIAAAMFTSRSTMVLIFLLIAGFSIVFLVRGRWSLKVVSATYLAVGSGVAITYVLPLIIASFAWGGGSSSEFEFAASFAATDLSLWWDSMWRLPDSSLELLFGSGSIIETSDVGYVKMIFMIGILGFLIVLAMYGYMLFVALRMRRSAQRGEWSPDTETWVLLLSLTIFIVALFLMNIKNLYFLTRGYHELMIIMFFYLAGAWRVGLQHADGEQSTEAIAGAPH
jgi:hypothetical protein